MNSSVNQEFNFSIFIANGTILLLFALLISISNGLLLFTIYKDPLKTFRNATSVLVVALGITDLLTGCVTAVDVGISHILEGLAIRKVMLQAKIISQVTVRASVFIMTMFAVERFIAVAFPYVYRFSVTIKKTVFGCVLCWLLAILTSCLELVVARDLYDVIFLYFTFVVPLMTVCITYCASYWLMQSKTKGLYRSASKQVAQRGSMGEQKDKTTRLSAKLQAQLMKTATLIIMIFVLSLLPFWSFTIIGRYCKGCKHEKWYIACYRFSIPILYSNSALNPLLYAWRMRPFRRSFQALFTGERRLLSRGSSSVEKTLKDETCARHTNVYHDETKL